MSRWSPALFTFADGEACGRYTMQPRPALFESLLSSQHVDGCMAPPRSLHSDLCA